MIRRVGAEVALAAHRRRCVFSPALRTRRLGSARSPGSNCGAPRWKSGASAHSGQARGPWLAGACRRGIRWPCCVRVCLNKEEKHTVANGCDFLIRWGGWAAFVLALPSHRRVEGRRGRGRLLRVSISHGTWQSFFAPQCHPPPHHRRWYCHTTQFHAAVSFVNAAYLPAAHCLRAMPADNRGGYLTPSAHHDFEPAAPINTVLE